MQQMLRKRTVGSQNINITKEEHDKTKDDSKSMTTLWRCLNVILERILAQDYESVQSILVNFGIVAALLLSILLSLILTVPFEESARGDILSLSQTSAHFRCHFAPSNTTTIEFCSPNFTIALFGTTDRTIICNATNYKVENGYGGGGFYCSTGWILGSFLRKPSVSSRLLSGRSTGFQGLDWEEGCSSSTFKEAYLVSKTITQEDYMEYMMEETSASDDMALWFGRFDYRDNGTDKFSVCMPSRLMTSAGFHATLYLMLALFFDLYLLTSLTFTSASTNPVEMRMWWMAGGAPASLLVLFCLLNGTKNMMWSLLFLVIIRFPFPFDQMLFQLYVLSTFDIFGQDVGIGVMIVHFVLVRLLINLWPLFKSYKKGATNDSDVAALGGGDNQACNEIQEIQDVGNRKLLQKAKLDAHKLMPYLNDTLLLNSLLLETGITTPGERLEIITTLRTIDRGNIETTLGSVSRPLDMRGCKRLPFPMSQSPHMDAQFV